MNTPLSVKIMKDHRGFTFFEVMVSLIIGTVIMGGVMGVISVSLQYTQRLQEKALIQPVLEAVAQEILADPGSAEPGTVVLKDIPDAPPVDVSVVEMGDDAMFASGLARSLRRVRLQCRGQVLEFSILVPLRL